MLDSVFRSKSCSSDNEILHNRHVIFTHKGRSGLGLLCHHWNLKVGYEVLMPAYNCGTEIDPFIYHGLRIIFYRVNNEAQIDLNDLQRRVTTKTKVIMSLIISAGRRILISCLHIAEKMIFTLLRIVPYRSSATPLITP
jgi:hypothetical protein